MAKVRGNWQLKYVLDLRSWKWHLGAEICRIWHLTWSVFHDLWCTPFYLGFFFFLLIYWTLVSRDSSVDIATRYGLDGPGIEFLCGRDFPYPSRPALGPTQLPMGTGSFPETKRPNRGVDHSSPTSAEFKARVELYLYSPSGPSRPVLVWTSSLPLPLIYWTLSPCPSVIISRGIQP
jgi:hypothetical protein